MQKQLEVENNLGDHEFINLITFTSKGIPKSTTLWFSFDKLTQKIFINTFSDSRKVARLNNTRFVQLSPSDATGNELGEYVDGTARILTDFEERFYADLILEKKYKKAYRQMVGKPVYDFDRVFIEITLKDE